MKALFISISAIALLAASPVYAGCSFGNPHDCIGPAGPAGPQGPQGPQGETGAQGPQGDIGPQGPQGVAGIDGKDGADGAPGAKGDKGDTGATGAQGIAGKNGTNGVDGKNGVNGLNGRDGRNFDSDDTLALSAALSPPVWLGDKETVRVSVGTGFNEGAAAVGAAGVVRIDGGLAGFVGGAVSTETGAWAGKAGISLGW
jgi:hypothetical protein